MDKYWTKYGAGIGKAEFSWVDVAERSANCKRVKKVALIGALGNYVVPLAGFVKGEICRYN